MGATGSSWAGFASAAPDIAAAGQRLLEDAPGIPGVALLGTVGADGLPRMHPFIPAIADGRLWAFVIESPKQRDLDRTQAFGLHSALGAQDESFFCAGQPRKVDDAGTRALVGSVMPYGGIDAHHVLYELRLAKALWTVWVTPTDPTHRSWRAADP